MKRIGALIVATAALAVGAAPAYALDPPSPDIGATAGNALATGGDGGSANTGNVQVLNGNSVAVGLGGKADADGGDTHAKSGDAYAGDGGDAKAIGGDAKSSTEGRHEHADRSDHNWSEHDGQDEDHCEKHGDGPRGKGPKGGKSEHRGDAPKATGGEAKAYGGDGGHANTGNVQFLNGNAFALSFGKDDLRSPLEKGQGGDYGHKRDGAEAEGGDTCAESGDAYGGDGGDAFALGGDAKTIGGGGFGNPWGDGPVGPPAPLI